MDTVCSKCGTVLRPFTDRKRILIADNGGQVCSKCYWNSKGKKKNYRPRGRGFKRKDEPRGEILSI